MHFLEFLDVRGRSLFLLIHFDFLIITSTNARALFPTSYRVGIFTVLHFF